MHGSVAEWCADRSGVYRTDTVDPAGPSSGLQRIVRGGSWYSPAKACRSAARNSLSPVTRNTATGFRIVVEVGNRPDHNSAAMDFYDDIADSYAELTATVDRRATAGRFVKELTRRFDITSAVDAACGTGLFAIELARRGVQVVGSDISAGMLKLAPANAIAAGIDTDLCTWLQAPMQELGDRIPGARDAVLCMGNSIPHLLTDDGLGGTIAGFAAILAGGGVVVIHLLNYARVLSANDRIVGITRAGSKEFVRFYDFDGDLVGFNILEIQWADDGRCSHKLLTTPLRPYLHSELIDALAAAGFKNVETFGDLQFNHFDPDSSDTLLLTATIYPEH